MLGHVVSYVSCCLILILIFNIGNAKLIIDPTLDGRKEIANFNLLMDQIFVRMNLAIRVSNDISIYAIRDWTFNPKYSIRTSSQLQYTFQAKNLDPMDLKVMSMLMANPPKIKVPRFERYVCRFNFQNRINIVN